MYFKKRLSFILSTPFLVFTLLLAVKMVLVWYVVFDIGHLWQTLGTGIPSVWVFFCLAELLMSRRKWLAYLLIDLVLTSVYFAVIMYYKYFGVIATWHELRQANQITEVESSMISLLDPYFLFIFTDIVVLGLLFTVSRRLRQWARLQTIGGPDYRWFAAGFLATLAICIACVLPYIDILNEFEQAQSMGVLNYEVYAGFAGTKITAVDPQEITPQSIASLQGEDARVASAFPPKEWKAAEGKNVIIIQLEAFQNFLIGLHIDGVEVTPVMNKLADEHFYFPHFFQQVGQGNTADAEFVVNTSMYPSPNDAASEVFADKALPGMPKLFAEHGYQTATFHTNDVRFWNRDMLYKALGWEKYYDAAFFGNGDPVMFAASDEVLYEKTADELARLQENGKPIYAQVISMSGHHPFNIPAEKYRMTLPERYEGTLVGDYIRAQNYADAALGQFVDKLKANGVWDNSVIILYGDHQGLPIYSLSNKEKKRMSEIYGRTYEITDMMNIPLIISVPGADNGGRVFTQIGGQVDIFPTVANLIGVSMDKQIHFGRDLLNQASNLLPERYYLPTGSLITDRGAFVPGKSYADGISYPWEGGAAATPAATEDEYERALRLLGMSDSYMTSLPEWEE